MSHVGKQVPWADYTGRATTLWQLFLQGPTADGDLISKDDRDFLVKSGMADRHNGYNFLTSSGVQHALHYKMDSAKEQWHLQNGRR